MPSDPRAEGPEELCRYVRERLPLRARLLGNGRVEAIVMRAIAEWPIDDLLECERGSREEDYALSRMAAIVTTGYSAAHKDDKQYGTGILLAFVLSSVISAIVQVILKWWLEKRSRRMKMAVWQYSMKGHP